MYIVAGLNMIIIAINLITGVCFTWLRLMLLWLLLRKQTATNVSDFLLLYFIWLNFLFVHLISLYYPLISEKAIRTRMKSYRDMFRRSFLQLPSGSSFDLDALTSPKRDLIKMCWFLKDHLQSKETISNLPEPSKTRDVVCG